MKNQFLKFQTFNNKKLAAELGQILESNKIDFLLEDNILSFDPTFANNSSGNEFIIKLRMQDFERADKLLEKINETDTNEIDNDYYLFNFTDEELFELIEKRDEWSHFDFVLAKKILQKRGNDITDEKIEKIRENRIAELSKPEKSQKKYIIAGYIFALLGGLLGVFIGWHLSTYKKTLPNGTQVFAYSENDRKQGNRILKIGLLFFIVSILFKILLET